MKSRSLPQTITTAFALALPTPAIATDYIWLSSFDNDFDNIAVWSPGGYPDDGNDVAKFSAVSGNFNVQFKDDETNDSLRLALGSPKLILWETFIVTEYAYQYTLDAPGTAANISSSPGSLISPVLTVEGMFLDGQRSSVEATGFLQIAVDANTKGQLTLDGADWNSTAISFIGVSGQGRLDINEPSEMTNSTGIIGQNPGSNGTVNVNGENFGGQGTWTNTTDLLVGWFGNGLLNNNGMVTNRNAFIATEPGSTGHVNMPRGTWTSTQSMFIGGDALAQGGTATVNHQNGTITVQDSVTVWGTGDFINDDGILNITNDLTLKPNATMNISGPGFSITAGAEATVGGHTQLDPTSKLTIDDLGAEFTTGSIAGGPGTLDWTSGTINVTNGDFNVDPAGPTTSFTIINTDMHLNVSDTLRVGTTASAGLFIINTATVTTNNLEIANTPASTSAVSVSVAGDGTTLDVTNDITLGNNASAGAQLIIADAAVVNSNNTFASPLPTQHAELFVGRTAPVANTAQWHSAGSVYLGGTDTTPGGTANFDISEDGLATIAGTLRVWDNATLIQDQGSLTTPLLHHSGTFNHTGPLDLTGAGPITALILDGGTINATSIDFANVDLTGHGTLNAKVTNHATVTATGPLTMGDPTSFTALNLTGPLNVGPHTVTLHQQGFFNIGPFTTIDGGTLAVPNGAALPVGTAIVAHGNIDARIVQIAGSTIMADGNLTLGDPAALDGYFSDGILYTDNANKITIQDANQAVLGSLTTLGDPNIADSKGNLSAPNALILEFGKNLQGFGTVDTPNDPAKPVINNGHIQGHAPDRILRLEGYIKGAGTFQDVLINGTLAPGFSPGINHAENIAFGPASVYEAEVISPTTTVPGAGVHHDQLNVTGNVALNGTLAITPLPTPDSLTSTPLGTEFPILTYDTRTNFYHTITGALINTAFALAPILDDTLNQLTLRATIPGDLNLDNKVSVADLSTFALNFGTTPGLYNELDMINSWQLGDFNTDGQVTVADLSLLALNFGFDATDPTSVPLGLSLSDAAAMIGLDPATLPAVPEPATATLILTLALAAPRTRPKTTPHTHQP